MTDSDPTHYGRTWAPIYDEAHAYLDPAAAVEVLHELAAGGPALELGIGTGRVALPLVARGTPVHGIEISDAMIAKLRAKPGGADLPITLGDFTHVTRDERYALVYIVFSTLFGPLTQDAQIACIRNAAAHLAPGGLFVVEGFVPDPTRFDRNQRLETKRIADDRVELIASRHDPATQRVSSQLVVLASTGVQLHAVEIRYAWPSEVDLMARLAGLRLRDRWGGWKREPFTSSSGHHVSIYERG
jgi:SAM-dependent methyltransferase